MSWAQPFPRTWMLRPSQAIFRFIAKPSTWPAPPWAAPSRPARGRERMWCDVKGSNLRPPASQTGALFH